MSHDAPASLSTELKDPATWVPLILAGGILWAFSGRYGPAQFFILGFPGLATIYAVVGAIRSADRSRRLKAVLHGVLLAVAVVPLMRIEHSLVPAREFALKIAQDIQAICVAQGECPQQLAGWESRRAAFSQQRLFEGPWLDWPLRYRTDGRNFEIELYVCLDIEEAWKGGVDQVRVVKAR